MFHLRRAPVLPAIIVLSLMGNVDSADWPMWRRDAARSARSAEELPDELRLRWVRQYPKLKAAYRESRLQFDAGYEPVVLGKSMFIASSRTDSLTALHTETGEELWEYYAAGPIRLAPAAWQERVFFGSDDGFLYCVKANEGELLWKFQAVPSGRKVLGNGRMISLWPVRGGPVVHEGKIYFAAGVWPFEGVFVYCLDALSGDVVWRNDESSYVYGQHPPDAKAMGGVSPQGYLVVAENELVVPCGQAVPARFDLQTGKLKSFELPKPGRRPGGWFVASAAVRRGEVTLDADINRDLHEDKVYQGPGAPGVRSTITVNDKALRFADGLSGVDGQIHSMLAADGKLFVVDVDGRIYCFGEETSQVRRYHPNVSGKSRTEAGDLIARSLETVKARRGYALLQTGAQRSNRDAFKSQIDTLLRQTQFHVVVTGDEGQLAELRRDYRDDRQRLCLITEDDARLQLPPYFAGVMISDTLRPSVTEDLQVLRPYGGAACFALTAAEHSQLQQQVESLGGEFSVERSQDLSIVRRGELPGAANYVGGWSSPDERVRAPLGVLWFDDTFGHFKRSPQPWFVDGVMVSYPKNWMEKHRTNRKPPYDLLPPVLSDVYTGRVIESGESIVAKLRFPERDVNEKQPNQYRPPTQRDAWKPKQPIAGTRVNPLTGQQEARAIPKSYGCDGGVDYGNLYTMRSGTPAFYDKRLESGVCNISGPRSGCTNSIIPACGVLNVPFFYEGCTCSYPLPIGLSLVSLPPQHEQWSSWGPSAVENIQRVGVNFGAPGDRMSPVGTLWLAYPNRGAPSPDLSVQVEPESARYFYQHSLFMNGGSGWPWVAASGVEGAHTVKVGGLRSSLYTVRLSFAELQSGEPRGFDISLNGVQVATNLDVAGKSGGVMRAVTLQFEKIQAKGELLVELHARQGQTVLSGVEIVADGLELD